MPDTQQRCVILLVHEKVMPSGTSKNPAQRALKRIAPKLLELVIVSLPIARTFCGRLLDQYLKTMSYFDPAQDWPKPIEDHVSMAVVWEELAFVGDTRSRHELLVFAQANQSRLPLVGVVSLVALSLAVLGGGPSRSVLFSAFFSERGGRFPVEPWTRLHCSELYWRCPVVLPAVQSGAPECSKACPYGSLCGCSVLPWQWPTRWERVASSGKHS